MDIVRLNIPYAFIISHYRPSWRSVLFGLQNELINSDVPKELAGDQLGTSDALTRELVDLAYATHNADVLELVEQLAATEPTYPEATIRDEWLYLVLAWTYDHRHELPDPLRRVEEIYGDFGYPEQIVPFVRYMPTSEPDLGSREAAEGRIFERWRDYLEDARRALQVRR